MRLEMGNEGMLISPYFISHMTKHCHPSVRYHAYPSKAYFAHILDMTFVEGGEFVGTTGFIQEGGNGQRR